MTRSPAPAGQAALATARTEGTRARLVLLVLGGASFMVALDISILNVALPRLVAGRVLRRPGRAGARRHDDRAHRGFAAATLGGIRLGLAADAAVVIAAALALAVLLRRSARF